MLLGAPAFRGAKRDLLNVVNRDLHDFYGSSDELRRLTRGIGPLEFIRTQELLLRHLPKPRATVCDIGSGPGAYSFWLASLGYDVQMLDLVPLHVEQAKDRVKAEGGLGPSSMQVGDARNVPYSDSFADAVILHGPLYHLTARGDRLRALREAHRILKPTGVLFAFAISRYASAMVGLVKGWIFDADYFAMCREEITSGQHIRPASWPKLFTNAHFHGVEELQLELEQCGFRHQQTLGVQTPVWQTPDFDSVWSDPQRREQLLALARHMEDQPAMSPHMLAVAVRS
jgi:SAM-dependent methyltransferase